MATNKESGICSTLLMTMLASTASAGTDDSCRTDNPFSGDQEASELEKRQYLLRICGTWLPDGSHALVDPGSADAYLILVNDARLARYDTDCSLSLDPEELRCAVLARTREIETNFQERVGKARKRASARIGQWETKLVERDPIPQKSALRVLPDPPVESRSLSLGYTQSADDSQRSSALKASFAFLQTKWPSPTSNSQLGAAINFDLSRQRVETATTETETRTADFLPLSFDISPHDRLTLSASAGLAYVTTNELTLDSGARKKSTSLAYAYKAGMRFQTEIRCLSLGVDYTIRTDQLASDRLSYEWLPMVRFNLLEPCKIDSSLTER